MSKPKGNKTINGPKNLWAVTNEFGEHWTYHYTRAEARRAARWYGYDVVKYIRAPKQ